MTKDLNKNISSIKYNFLSLPAKIAFSGGKTTKYTYAADGRKLRVTYPTAVPATTKTVDYRGSIVYEDGSIKQLLVDGGYVTFDNANNANLGIPTYHFYIQDHLGNNRVVVNQSGSVEQVNHYYPYGGLMAESTGHNVQRYKYNGKEFDRMHRLDWYDYGARFQDPAIGRWTTVDPLAEKNYDVSPYAYCHNNPVMRIDPDGMDDYFSSTGQFLYSQGNGANMMINQNGKFVNLNTYRLNSRKHLQAAANIVGHYARAVGIKYKVNGGKGNVGVSTMHGYDNDVLAGTLNGDIYIKVTNGKFNSELYNLYNLRGTLIHENGHKEDQLEKRGPADSGRHCEIILNEMSSQCFQKGTNTY